MTGGDGMQQEASTWRRRLLINSHAWLTNIMISWISALMLSIVGPKVVNHLFVPTNAVKKDGICKFKERQS